MPSPRGPPNDVGCPTQRPFQRRSPRLVGWSRLVQQCTTRGLRGLCTAVCPSRFRNRQLQPVRVRRLPTRGTVVVPIPPSCRVDFPHLSTSASFLGSLLRLLIVRFPVHCQSYLVPFCHFPFLPIGVLVTPSLPPLLSSSSIACDSWLHSNHSCVSYGHLIRSSCDGTQSKKRPLEKKMPDYIR